MKALPALASVWKHSGYGRAEVVAVSQYFSTGEALITVHWSPPLTTPRPAEFSTYPLGAFHERFAEVPASQAPTGDEARELWNCEQALLAEYMLDQGGAGHFFQTIAEALRRADPANLLKLYLAFPVELHGYLVRQRAWAKINHRDQA